MHHPPPPVFISYSRRDYYFAESLSLQLLARGVPAWMDVLELQPGADWERALFDAIDGCSAFVLVASPAALASPHVRTEWQRALAQGRRVLLLAWHRRARLPPELQGCEWLDFRGRFGPALRRLTQHLAGPQPHARRAGPALGRWPRLPPAVLVALAALLLPIAGYVLGTQPDASLDDFAGVAPILGRTGALLLMLAMSAAFVWWISLSLLQRRMGMTRLMLSLGFVAAPFVLTVGKWLRYGPDGLSQLHGHVAERVLAHLPWVVVLGLMPVLALAWIALARPPGLLHWMPTGKAWERQRRPAAALRPSAATPAQALAQVRRYRVVCDAADASLADSLRAWLARQGAVEVAASRPDDAAGTAPPLLLLSNRTGRDWLQQQAAEAADPSLRVVVATAISLPPDAGWLWRRQWIDLRRGAGAAAATPPGLPALPEAVTGVRLPAPVARLHALLCALGVLAWFLDYLLMPQALRDAEEPTPGNFIGALLGLGLAWCARRLLRREAPARAWQRWAAAGVAGAVLFIGVTALGPGLGFEARLAGITAAVAAVLMAAAAWRSWPQARPWLPLPGPPLPRGHTLAPPGDWRTTLTLIFFMFAWLLPVQLLLPQLMPP